MTDARFRKSERERERDTSLWMQLVSHSETFYASWLHLHLWQSRLGIEKERKKVRERTVKTWKIHAETLQ